MRILISGASGAVGRSLAEQIIRQAPRTELVLLGKTAAKLEQLDDRLRALGAPPPLLVPLDFAKATAAHVQELTQQLQGEGLDGLALGAATLTGLHPLDHLKPAEFERILKVGLQGHFWLVHHLLPLLKQAPAGRVLGISDAVGAEGKAFWGAYGIAKSGLDTLLAQLAAETENQLQVRRVVPPSPVASPLRGLVWPGEDPASLPDPATFTAEWAAWLVGAAVQAEPASASTSR